MKHIEIKWGGEYAYLVVNGRVVYKSKSIDKVNARYEQMVKLEQLKERRREYFKNHPYGGNV